MRFSDRRLLPRLHLCKRVFFALALPPSHQTAGAFIFAFSVGAIGSLDEMRMKKSEQLQLDINAMRRFLTRYPLPDDLVKTITNYYHYNLKQAQASILTRTVFFCQAAHRCELRRSEACGVSG